MNRLSQIVIVVALMAIAAPAARAQDGMGRLLAPRMGGLPAVSADYEATGTFTRDVDNQAARLHYFNHDLDLSVPLSQDKEHDWTFDLNLGQFDLHSEAMLPTTGGALPDDLWEVWFGTTYRQQFDGWTGGLSAKFGSPSDKPFNSIEEMAVRINLFARLPDGERNAWVFLLNYASDREFARHIPLPGFAYQWQVDPSLRLFLGVPVVTADYRPIEPLALSFRYMMLRTVHAQAAYEVADGVTVFGAFDWSNRGWWRHDRPDDDHQLFFYEKRLTTGVEVELSEQATLRVSGGYAFDRRFFEGEDYDDNDRNRIDVEDGPFLSLQLTLRL